MFLTHWLNFLRRPVRRKPVVQNRRRVPVQPMTSQTEQLEIRQLLTVDPLVITVDIADDSTNGNTDEGDISLREAIEMANDNPGEDRIEFSESLKGSTIIIDDGELLINDDLTIVGLGADNLTISGANANRVFRVEGSDVLFAHFSVADGYARGGDGEDSEFGGGGGGGTGMGGAIFVNTGSDVVVQNMIFLDNQAVGGDGGDSGVPGAGNEGGSGGASSLGEDGGEAEHDATNFGTGGGGGNGSADGTTSNDGGAGLLGGGGGGGGGATGSGGLRGTIGDTFDDDKGDEPIGVGVGGNASDGTLDDGDLTIDSAPAASGGGGGGGAGLGGAIFVRDGGGLSVVDTHFARNWAVGGEAGRHSTGIGAGVGGAIFAMDGVIVDAVGITFGNGSDQANLQSTNQNHSTNPNTQAFEYDTSAAISNSAVYGQFVDELPEVNLISGVETPDSLGQSYLNFAVVGQNYDGDNQNGASVTGVHTILERVGRNGIRDEVSEFNGIAITEVDDSNGIWYALVDGERQIVSSSSTIDLNELLGVPAILKTDATHYKFEAVVTDSEYSYDTGVKWTSGSTIRIYINTHFGTTIGSVLDSLKSFTDVYDQFAMQIVPSGLSEFADSEAVDAYLATELTEGVSSTSFTRAVSYSNALLLSGSDQLTFLPNETQSIWEHYYYHYGRKSEYGVDFAANFDYSPFETLTRPQPTITFRAWDQSSGSAGDYANSSGSSFSSATEVATVDVVNPLYFVSNSQDGADSGVTVYLTPDTHVPVVIPTDLIPVTGNRQFQYMLTSPGEFGAHIEDFDPNAITLTYRDAFDYGHDHQIDGSLEFSSLGNVVHSGPSHAATPSASVRFGYYTVQGQDTGPIAFIRSQASTTASMTHFSISDLEGGTFYKDAEFTEEVAANEFISYGNGNAYLYFRPDAEFTGTATYRVIESTSDDFTGTANPAAYTEADTDAPIFLLRTLAASYANANQVKITNIQNGSLYRLDGETEVPVTDGTTLDWEITGLNGSLELFFRPAEGFVGNATFDIQSVVDNEGSPEPFGDPITKTVTVLRVEKIHVVNKPTISIQEVDSFEGTDGESVATFIVSRFGDLSLIGETTVDYTVSLEEGDTASEDDFADGLVTGTITFRQGENYRVIQIPISTDTEVEANESFTLTLSNATSNVEISDTTIQGRIWNDDFADFIVEADPSSIVEGDGEEKTIQFTVTLQNKIDGGIVVDYETYLSSSYEGEHEEKEGQFEFEGNIGETNQITVTFTGDDVYERYERLYLRLDAPSYNGEIVPFKNLDDYVYGSAEISNDDVAILTASDGYTSESVGSQENPNDRVMRFYVSTNDYVDEDITFDYTTVLLTDTDNPAIAEEDYTPVTGTATISAYSRYLYIDVPILDNDIVEGTESFGLKFSNVNAHGFQVRLENAEFETLETTTIEESTSQPLQIVTDGDFTYVLSEDALRVFGTTIIEDTEVFTELLSLPSSNYGGISSFSVSDGVLIIADGQNGGFARVTLNGDRTAIESSVATTADPDSHSLPVYNFVQATSGPIVAANATGLELLSPDGSGEVGESDYDVKTWADLGLAAPQDMQIDAEDDDVLYVLDSLGVFAVIDISDPSNIQIDGSIETNSSPTQLDVEGSIAYLLGDTESPLIMLDFSDTDEIAELTRNTDVNGEDLDVRDHMAYVLQSDGSVAVYDVYKPGNIFQTDSITAANGEITALFVSNGTVYTGQFNSESMTASLVQLTAAEVVAEGHILDDDVAYVNINDITITEADSTDTSKTFVVSLTEQVDRDVTISFMSVSGTATDGVDYRTKVGELTITAGQLSGTVTLEVTGDTIVEDTEYMSLYLTYVSANGASVYLSDSVGAATIHDNDSAQISVANVSASEGSEEMQFVASLDRTVDRDVTFKYTVSAGTANGTSDYTATTGSVTILAGQSSTSFSIPLVNDGVVELDETFTVSFSDLFAYGRSVSLPSGSATGTILNDDVAVLDFVVVGQTESAGGQATFQFELSAPVDHDVQFNYTTVDGTAIAGSDYQSKTGTVTIAAGDTTASVSINLLNDSVVEETKAFSLSVSSLQSGGLSVSFAKQTASLTISDDDQATVSIDDLNSVENATTKEFTISLSGVVDHDVVVDFTTVDGTAKAGSDYVAKSGSVTIAAGETTATVSVELLNDDIVEGDEVFALQLSNIQAGGANVNFETSRGEFSIEDNDAAQVSIGNVTRDENADTAVFSVTLDQVVDHDVKIEYETTNGTATAGTDFVAASGTLTIPAGETTGSITVSITDDQLVELNETFGVQLSNPQSAGRNVTITQNSASATIQDNDTATVSVGDVSVTEVADGQATFVISLSQPVDRAVTVDFTTIDSTALAGSDYTAKSGSVTIAAGETSASVSVDLLNDNIVEVGESFSLEISDVSASGRNVSIADDSATATVSNDDSATVSVGDISVTEVADGQATFVISLSQPVDRAVTVDFTTIDGTAQAGSDYTAKSGSVTIAAGETSATVSVDLLNDNIVEIGESFSLEISDVSASGREVSIADDTATATISNDDSATVSVSDVSVTEVADGQATFVISLSQPVDRAVTVDFTTIDGTALADSDYTAKSGSVTIAAGETSATVTVDLLNDDIAEIEETFSVQISNVSASGRAVTIADASGTGMIADDDQSLIQISDVSVTETAEGDIEKTFTVTLSKAIDHDVLIDFATVDGTAQAGSDYTATSGTLTIPAGQTSGTITVTVLDDQLVEIEEAFFVELSNARASNRGVAIGDNRGAATISDNDQATVSISNGRSQMVSGTQSVVFNVTLSQPSDADVVIDFATADGTAVAGETYAATTGTLTIEAGETSGQIVVDTINSRINTTALTFTIALSNLESNGRSVTIDDAEGEAVINAVLQSVVTSTIDPETMAVDYPQSVSGNFDGDTSQRKDDLLFWDPVTGENLLVLEDGTTQVNAIDQTIVNDDMFLQVVAGDFDGGGSDDLFFWDPVTGANRLLHLSFDINANEVSTQLQNNAIERTAINNSDFNQVAVGNFDEGGSQDLFFWNSATGMNRFIHLNGATVGESTVVAGIQTNVVPQAAVNGELFESVYVGNFIAGGPDELMFLNSNTGANRLVQLATETPGASTSFVSVRVNVISPSAINGNMFSKTAIGDFNSDGLDELFFWDPKTGGNRLAIVDNTFAELDFAVLDNPVSPTAINGNEYTNLVSRADGANGDELFFWNALDGNNRVVSSNLPTL